jgi:hypothetical protein
MKMAAFAILLWLGTSAHAQETRPTADCYAISPPVPGTPHVNVLRINKCTGATWVLVKIGLPKVKSADPNGFTYRWYQINEAEGEAYLVRDSLN